MRPCLAALSLGLLSIGLGGCNKPAGPAQSTESAERPAPAPAVAPADDLARLAADLKGNDTRRATAVGRAAALAAQGFEVVPALLESLRDPAAGELGSARVAVATSTREAAVLALLKLGDKGKKPLVETGLKTLEEGLNDNRPNVREHTANAIGMVGPEARSSASALMRLCTDKEPPVRSAAYSALERVKPVPAEPILKLLGHPDAEIAADAASALAWLKPTGPTAIPLLLDAVKREAGEKDDPVTVSRIRNAAAEALGDVGKGAETAVPALVELVRKTRAEDVERMARPSKEAAAGASLPGPIVALRRIGGPAVAAVSALLKSDEAIVRFQAAAILGGMGPIASPALPDVLTALEAERGLPTGQFYVFEELTAAALNMGGDAERITAPVLALLNSEEEGVRSGACRLITRIGRKATAAVPRLIELLDDPVAQVQVAAAEAIGAIGRPAKNAAASLAKKVGAEDIDLARAAARTLRSLGTSAAPAVPALARALDSNDESFTAEAAQALAAVGPEAAAAEPSLVKLLENPRSRTDERRAALHALAAIGPAAKSALPAVTRVLADKDFTLRAVAAETLGNVGGGSPEATRSLTDALRDTHLIVHLAALKALAGLGPAGSAAAVDVQHYHEKTRDAGAKVMSAATLLALGVEPDKYSTILLSALKDKTPARVTARVAAMDVVEFLGPKAPAAVADLRDALKDRSPVSRGDRGQVRERAARALGRLGGDVARPAIPSLVELLRDPDLNIRGAAVEALGRMGPVAVVAAPKLRELARTDPALADAALDALERIEPPPKNE